MGKYGISIGFNGISNDLMEMNGLESCFFQDMGKSSTNGV